MRTFFILPIAIGIFLFSILFYPRHYSAQVKPKPEHEISDRSSRRYPGKDWSSEKLSREAIAQHELNRQRLAQQGKTEAVFEANVTDMNDISVVEDDGSIVVQANAFDLTGKTVNFIPNGGGYMITNTAGSFDSNFGTRLDLTQAPAVNPKIATNPQVEPGDDAYISQDIGFNFSYYGTVYTRVAISSNGNLTFRPPNISDSSFDDGTVDSGESIATLQYGLPRIAPYWHDLDARAATTVSPNGIYIRKEADRVVITWNNVRDFPNRPSTDNGTQRFQATLFNDGRIRFAYDSMQLTSKALTGISPGSTSPTFTSVEFSNPTSAIINTGIAEYFSTTASLDELSAIASFYRAHPNQDVYDFFYIILDFNADLGGAFAFYQPLRNEVQGIGESIFDSVSDGSLGGRRLFGLLNLSNLAVEYPDYPTERFLGANHGLSIIGQEQGHRWLSYVRYTGSNTRVLLGRDFAHWSFFYQAESSTSHPAAPRSSSAEGNVWKENGEGTFTTTNLVDGFSRLDHYLMGLRPASEVPLSFLIINPTGTRRTANSSPNPNETVTGNKQVISIDEIIQANGARNPGSVTAQKNFRAATLLLTQRATAAKASTITKLTRYRLAWESYFAQSTDFLATINTGLANMTVPRNIVVTNGGSYGFIAAPGAICSIFGQGLTSGGTFSSTPGVSLPFNLGGVEVKVNGTSAPLFFVGPDQINFQLPRAIPATTFTTTMVQSASATVEVFSNGQLIRACAVQLAPSLIGTFTTSQNGSGAAAALDAITFASAPFNAKQANGQPNFVALFVTGLGLDGTDIDGNVKANVQVTLNGAPVTVDYAGRAPGFTGLNQVNIQFPANITAGTYNVVVSRNGFPGNTTTITVK